MSHEFVLSEVNEKGVATVTLSREKALNALNQKVLSELKSVLNDLRSDARVGAVVLTGAGDKSFVAGADIKEMQNHTQKQAEEMSKFGQSIFASIESLGKPVVAAVNGFALGGGFELAMSCSFIIASETAKFGLPEVTLGLIPGYGGTQRLPRLIGLQKAKRMVFSGEMIGAQKAYEWGLVTEVVPLEELLAVSQKIAEKMARLSRHGIAHALQSMEEGIHLPLKEATDVEAFHFGKVFTYSDKTEGINAFLEKRKAKFSY